MTIPAGGPRLPSPAATTPSADWPAPTADVTLDAVVDVPGSKSLTNRYLVLAALADGPGRLRAPLRSRDSLLMSGALRALGTRIDEAPAADGAPPTWDVRPGPLRGPAEVDCGLAGTVMRFVPPVAALAEGAVHFDGDPHARVRPMGPVIAALRSLGVTVDDDGRGALPFTVHGAGGVEGGRVEVDASASSQFVSALLLAAPQFRAGLELHHVGASLPSLPHIAMTVEVLRRAGVAVDGPADAGLGTPGTTGTPPVWRVEPGPIAARDLRVEPDLSNAGPFVAAALAAGGTVRIPGWPSSTTQPGALLPDLLTAMGGTAHLDGDVLTVTGTGTVHGVDVDLHAAGELAPTIAALAALADGPSRLRGIAHLRGHETDRLAALATEISRLGGGAQETEDGLVITPRPMRGTLVRTYADHRMATFAAIVGLAVPGVVVQDVATTAKTLPDFVGMWLAMLGRA